MSGRTTNSAAGAVLRKPAEGVHTMTYAPQASDASDASDASAGALSNVAAASRRWLLAPVVALLAASPVLAEAPPRVRGVVTGVDSGTVTVKERDGSIVILKTSSGTSYAYVVPSALDEVKVNDFVGTAVKGAPSSMVAVELAIIPENMRAGRISLYGWDALPDPTAPDASDTTSTSMINGLVSEEAPAAPELTKADMTKGVVSAEKGGAAGRALTVTYDGGSKRFQITVPPNAPVVRYVLADRSILTIGVPVMIKTNPGNQADLVTVGKDVTPPM